MSENQDYKLADDAMQKAMLILSEHFDTIDIVGSIVDSSGTKTCREGFGNAFARAKLAEWQADYLNDVVMGEPPTAESFEGDESGGDLAI